MKIIRWMSVMLLIVCLSVSLFGCGAQTDSTEESTTLAYSRSELETAARSGEMTGLTGHLKQSVSTIKESYHYGDPAYGYAPEQEGATVEKASDAENFEPMQIVESNDFTRLMTSTAGYFYRKGSSEISAIASYGAAYAFQATVTTESDLTAALGAADEVLEAPEKEDAFFIIGVPENARLLRYNFGDVRVDFLFVDRLLSATALVESSLWK